MGRNEDCVRAKVYKTHVSAPGLLHLPRQSQKMPENLEIPACNCQEKCFFFWPVSEAHLPGHFYTFLHGVVFTIDLPRPTSVQQTDQTYRGFATLFFV